MSATYESVTLVYGRVWLNSLLSALKTIPATPLLPTTSKIRLSSDPAFNPTPDSTIADLAAQEAAFSGYSAATNPIALKGPVNLSGQAVGMLQDAFWEAVTATTFVSGSVYGYWLDDGANIVCAERFAGGLVAGFAEPGDFLALTLLIPAQLIQPAS